MPSQESLERACDASSAAFKEIGYAFSCFVRHRKYIPAEYAERLDAILREWMERSEWTADADEIENYFEGIADGFYWRSQYGNKTAEQPAHQTATA